MTLMPSLGMSFVMLTLYKLLFDGFYWCNDTVMCEIGSFTLKAIVLI